MFHWKPFFCNHRSLILLGEMDLHVSLIQDPISLESHRSGYHQAHSLWHVCSCIRQLGILLRWCREVGGLLWLSEIVHICNQEAAHNVLWRLCKSMIGSIGANLPYKCVTVVIMQGRSVLTQNSFTIHSYVCCSVTTATCVNIMFSNGSLLALSKLILIDKHFTGQLKIGHLKTCTSLWPEANR